MNLRIFDTTSDLMAGTAEAIVQRIRAGDRVIGVSGGSTPKPVYEILGRNDELREMSLVWVVVDERYVPIDHPDSNAAMIQRTLFARGLAKQHRFLAFRTDFEDPSASAREFEREWRDLGLEQLDLAFLGIGPDGHTASLFPGTPVLEVEDRIASEVYVPRLDSWRVTLTAPVIRAAKMRFVQTAGSTKQPVLNEIRSGADYPITRITRDRDTWWFVDRAAVGSEG